jgi:predicted O-methyltransferase YrrM
VQASRSDDQFSLASATRPADLATLLGLARDRRRVVEVGTGTAWTAIALALADPDREVITYDPTHRPERERYMALAGARVRHQITFVEEPGSSGPQSDDAVDLLYIDGAHERQSVIDDFCAWRPVLKPGALVVLDDFDHPQYPGVREAVRDLDLDGVQRGTLFVHAHADIRGAG